VVSLVLANSIQLFNVFDSAASPMNGIKVIGSIIYKLFEHFDVIPAYITRKELKLAYQIVVQSQISSGSNSPQNYLDFVGFIRLLVATSVYALSKTSAYANMYPEFESKVEIMLTKWGFADPQKLQLVEKKIQQSS
jgi:hypothetical protein